jgi:hypothetical protein
VKENGFAKHQKLSSLGLRDKQKKNFFAKLSFLTNKTKTTKTNNKDD